MLREYAKPNFPIWLIGDSEPAQWREFLDTPIDSRHPIRHNIWTSVLDVIQDKVYREDMRRMDTSKLYIRNAIANSDEKPKGSDIVWPITVQTEIEILSKLLKQYQPFLVLCFGSFAFEFVNRANNEAAGKYRRWNTEELGKAFADRIRTCDTQKINVLPLLHRSISGGHFLKSHENFVGMEGANYFEYVGEKIAEVLLKNKENLKIWIRCKSLI